MKLNYKKTLLVGFAFYIGVRAFGDSAVALK